VWEEPSTNGAQEEIKLGFTRGQSTRKRRLLAGKHVFSEPENANAVLEIVLGLAESKKGQATHEGGKGPSTK
jgi:hypothetical protein